jgi:hypothetical protein
MSDIESEEMDPWAKETIYRCLSLTDMLSTMHSIKYYDFSVYEKCRLYSALKEVIVWISYFKGEALPEFPKLKEE